MVAKKIKPKEASHVARPLDVSFTNLKINIRNLVALVYANWGMIKCLSIRLSLMPVIIDTPCAVFTIISSYHYIKS